MSANLHDLPFVQHRNLVGFLHRGKPVSNHKRRAIAAQFLNYLLHHLHRFDMTLSKLGLEALELVRRLTIGTTRQES